MAISVSGTNPVQVVAASDTTTTNTTFNANAPNDRTYSFANGIIGSVNAGVTVGGFGLLLWSTGTGSGLDMINDGSVTAAQDVALTLIGSGGAVSYAGSGTVTNTGGIALALANSGAGSVEATISDNITGGGGDAITIFAVDGAVSLTQQAQSTISASLGSGLMMQTGSGDITATLNGTISGAFSGIRADSTSGDITVDLAGPLGATSGNGVDAVSGGAVVVGSSGNVTAPGIGLRLRGSGAGQLTAEVSGGLIRAGTGIEATSSGAGDILIDMSGGELGTSSERTAAGIRTRSTGTGDTSITATTIFSTGVAIDAQSVSTGDIHVTVNGLVESRDVQAVNFNGVGSNTATLVNNGTIRGEVGLTSFRPTTIFNTGTIAGTLGAISLNGAGTDDTVTLAPTSVIQGSVFAGTGNDRLQLGGAGVGAFNVATIGAGQQYRGFETFNVVEGTWLLAGTGPDAWNVLGGTLGGNALIGAVHVAAGALSPGAGAVLSTGPLSLAAGATYVAQIGDTGHGQVQVTGAVDLAGATLNVSVNAAVVPGTAFAIVGNDGTDAVAGTFAGLAEGAVVETGTARFSITYQGGSGNDVVLVALPRGTPRDDSFTAVAGSERIDALGGLDTVNFDFSLIDAAVHYVGNTVAIDGPSSHTVLTGVERFVFTDGTVENNDSNPLVDDLFYYSRNHDVWNARLDADAHYDTDGWHEGRDPSAFFSISIYLLAYPDVRGIDPLAHFDQHGWKEGRVPSLAFDPAAYLAANPDVAAAAVDPLLHFIVFGAGEGRQPIALTSLTTSNGFDYVHYLANNPDVAAAHVDPLQHFQQFGWKEGRNPNALFDAAGYLATYADVAAAGVNPLDHYNTFGWREGRDPSVSFDTTAYLAANPDVAAANVNPLLHYLNFGLAEGRQAFADGVWG